VEHWQPGMRYEQVYAAALRPWPPRRDNQQDYSASTSGHRIGQSR